MSLVGILKRSSTKAHVVCEIKDVDNKHVVEMVGEGMVEVLCPHDMIGRLMIGCARSSGVAHVLEILMGFEGDEFYLKEWKDLVGKRFGEIHFRFDDAIPVGIKHENLVTVNPDDDMVIQAGDEILVIAEDDDSYKCNVLQDDSHKYNFVLPKVAEKESTGEAILLCGWRRDLADMLHELDEQLPPKSEVWLLNSVPVQMRAELLLDKDTKEDLKPKNFVCLHVVGEHYCRRNLRTLQALDESNGKNSPGKTRTIYEFDSILILAEDKADVKTSDCHSLTSLLLIRDMQNEYRKTSGMTRNNSEEQLATGSSRKICKVALGLVDRC